MKEEKLAVLNMLEKGIINADEAERLLSALQVENNDLETKDSSEAAKAGLEKRDIALNASADDGGINKDLIINNLSGFLKKATDKAINTAKDIVNKFKGDVCVNTRDDEFEDEYYSDTVDLSTNYEGEGAPEQIGEEDFEEFHDSKKEFELDANLAGILSIAKDKLIERDDEEN